MKFNDFSQASDAFVKFSNGVVVINTTPHPITMKDVDGQLLIVPTSGLLLNGKAEETVVDDLFVTTKFNGTEEGLQTIDKIKSWHKAMHLEDYRLVIIGSIIAAQSYPGQVAAMCPVEGFERVPPAEKRMRCDKFTIY